MPSNPPSARQPGEERNDVRANAGGVDREGSTARTESTQDATSGEHTHEYDIALPSVDGWRYMGCECGATQCVGRYGAAMRAYMEFNRRVQQVKRRGRENPGCVPTWEAVHALLDDLLSALHPIRGRASEGAEREPRLSVVERDEAVRLLAQWREALDGYAADLAAVDKSDSALRYLDTRDALDAFWSAAVRRGVTVAAIRGVYALATDSLAGAVVLAVDPSWSTPDEPSSVAPSPPAARAPETCKHCGEPIGTMHICNCYIEAPADRTAEYAALLRRVVAWEEAIGFPERWSALMADIRTALEG